MEEQNKHPLENDPTHSFEESPSASDSTIDQESQETNEEGLLFEEEAELLPIPLEIIEAEIAREEVDELYLRNLEANKVVFSFSAAAAATGAIPIPFADAPVLIAEQIAMLAKLSEVYSINLKRSGLKSLVFAALGVSGTTILGKTITGSLFKMIPGLGSFGGAAINGTTAAALTAALGAAYGELCQKVFLGELDEKLLLSHEGKALLETSFKNHLRGEMKKREEGKDVLNTTPIPNQDMPISLHTELTPEECGQPLTPEQETVQENLGDLEDLIQNIIDQNASSDSEDSQDELTSQKSELSQVTLENEKALENPEISIKNEENSLEAEKEETNTSSQEESQVGAHKLEESPLEPPKPVEIKEEIPSSHQKVIKTHSKTYSQEDIDRLVTLYTTHEESSEHDLPSFSFPSSKLQK